MAAATTSWFLVCFTFVHFMTISPQELVLGVVGIRSDPSVQDCPSECLCTSPSIIVCDGRNASLTYIPPVPATTTELIFRNNYIQSIYSDFFYNVTSPNGPRIKHLDLTNNSIRDISTMAFSQLKYLLSLDLSENYLTKPDGLQKALVGLKHTRIERLVLTNMDINDDCLPPNIFQPLTIQNTLKVLDMRKNKIREFEIQWLTNVTSIEEIILSQNELIMFDINNKPPFSNLRKLEIRSNSLQEIPSFCPLNVFPNLAILLMEDNFITYIYSDELSCLSKLEELSLGQNPINYVPENLTTALTRLRILRMNYLFRVPVQIMNTAFESSSLEVLSLIGNELDTSLLELKTFSRLSNLQVLDLDSNEFNSLKSFRPEEIEGFFPPNLENLSLRNCRLDIAPRFKHRYLKQLDISENCITKLTLEDFAGFPNLTMLNLNSNRLTRLDEDTFPWDFRERLNAIGTSDNPFICSCNIGWFKKWTEEEPLKFLTEGTESVCIRFDSSEVIKLNDYQENCSIHHRNIILIVGVVCGSFVISIVAFLLYYYRRNLSFFSYMTTRRREGDQLVLDNDTYSIV